MTKRKENMIILIVLGVVALLALLIANNIVEAQVRQAEEQLRMARKISRLVGDGPVGTNQYGTRILEVEPDTSMKPTTEASEAERQRRREAQQREAQETYPHAKAVSPREMVATPTPTP